MWVLLCMFCVFKVICSQSYPSSVFLLSNAITTDVSFTCNGTPPIDWQVNGTLYQANIFSHPGVFVKPINYGSSMLTIQQKSVLNYNGSSIRCRTNGDNFSSVPTAFVHVHGPPSEPGNLSSKFLSDGVLVFSWSLPWTPDGVQLHYTVTVTNTFTGRMRNYTTSNTSITVNVEEDGGCGKYVWSVTAVNPAGISVPANQTYRTTIPDSGDQFNLSYNATSLLVSLEGVRCVFNDVLNFSVVAVSICDKQPNTVILKPLNDTITFAALKQYNWTNITLMVENEHGMHVLSHSIKINRTVECPIKPSTSMESATTYQEFTQTIMFMSSHPTPSKLPPPVTEGQIGVFVAVGVVPAVLLIGLLIVTVVITIMCYMRKNNSARRKSHKLNTVDIGLVSQTSEKTGEQVTEDKSAMTSPSVSPRQLLPEYMTPADAMKEAKIVRRQSDGIGYLQTHNKTSQDADSSEDNVFQNITPSATMPEMKVVDTGHYSAVWNHKNTSSKATASPIGKNIKRHSSYSYKLTRPTVSPPQRNYIRTSSAGSAEPLQTAPGPYLQHIPLYSDHSTPHNTSNSQVPAPSKYANISGNVALTLLSGNIGASNGQSSQASSRYNHLLPSPVPSPTSSGGKSSSVFTDSSQGSCSQPLPLPGELAPNPTLSHSDGSQASQSSQVVRSTSSRSSSRMSSNRPLPRLPGEPDGNASPLLLDHTSTSPYAVTHTPPSSQYTGTNQPLPPLPGEPLADGSSFQDHFDYNHTPTNSHSYKTHNTQDLSHLQDHSPVTFSITDKNTSESYNNTDEQSSPQIDSAWYLN